MKESIMAYLPEVATVLKLAFEHEGWTYGFDAGTGTLDAGFDLAASARPRSTSIFSRTWCSATPTRPSRSPKKTAAA